MRKDLPPTLVSLCVMAIAKNFEACPIINELVLCADRDFLLEILPTDLPLSLVVPIIEDEIYWMRRYTNKYGVMAQHCHVGWTWKCIFLENHIQELIETAQPEYNDEENLEEITNLTNLYVHRLVISQLQAWKSPLTMDADEIPEILPCDHINLEPIFRRLQNVQELVIKFGMNNVGESFQWNMFRVSIDDAKHLAAAIVNLKTLRVLDLHASNIEDKHLQILAQELIKVDTLEELSMKNCLIEDQGALCIAKVMLTHPTLQKLILANNKIGGRGGEGIGYALTKDTCCPMRHLDLRLNPLGHIGVMGLFRALVRVQKVEELIISGVGFGDETGIRLGAVIQLNSALKLLDVSNNWCKPGEKEICNAILTNSTLQWLDIRETDISEPYYGSIMRRLKKNRKNDPNAEEEEEEAGEEEELMYEAEYFNEAYEGEGEEGTYFLHVEEEQEEESDLEVEDAVDTSIAS